MEKKYDSMGVIFESQTINDHTILNPINVVRCNSIDNMTYDVEFIGQTSSVFEGNFEDQHVSVGFVTKNKDLIKKYGSLEAGINALKNDTFPFILVQTNNDVDEKIQTFKVDLYDNTVLKLAEYQLEEEELKIENQQINISNDNNFTNFNINKTVLKNEELSNNVNQTNINTKQLYLAIKENIIGQDNTIKQIVSTIDRNYNIENYRQKTNILLIGPSGSGKTEMFRTISETINVPITIEDSEQYSAVGYYGNSVDDILINLYNKANGNLEAAEHGIIVIDEIDKKITSRKGDVSGDRVLNALLTMMEGSITRINTGSEYNPNYIMFDTSRVTFILAGAFSELAYKQKGIGINSELEIIKKYKDITIEDLNKYGLSSEILRRVSVYNLKELTVDNLVDIMKYSKNSALLEYHKYAEKKGVKLYIDDNTIKKIAEIAIKKNVGASSIKDTLNELLSDAFFEIGMNPDIYSSIKISEETINNNPPYVLYKKRNTKN